MSIRKEQIAIQDMQCQSCEAKIEKALRRLSGVSQVKANFGKSNIDISYNSQLIDRNSIEAAIRHAGYNPYNGGNSNLKLIGIFLIAIIIVVISSASDTFDIGTELSQDLTLAALFIIGLFTSIHCAGMCGGILFSQSLSSPADAKRATLRPALLYNIGRVVAYTLLGGLVGAIGSVFSLSLTAKAAITILAAVLMIIMGLGMTGIKAFRFSLTFPWSHHVPQSNRPFVVGLLNGFMPCGPLQTMQIYALGTGSFVTGAMSMLAFSLGTTPLLLVFGAFTGFVSRSYATKIVKFSGILIVTLGLVMVTRGLSLTGMNLFEGTMTTQTVTPSSISTKAERNDGIQVLRMTANRSGYVPNVLYVQKGVPVKWIITGEQLTSCNNEIVVPALKIQQKLSRGETIITFTPGEKDIQFSCWMGMLRGVIKVVDK